MTGRPLYLKLGGALITEKAGREAPRLDVLEAAAAEIASWRDQSARALVLAHGSGSYAHVAVRDTGFLERPGETLALAKVAAAARRLDGAVVDALVRAGIPAVPVPGSILAFCRDGRVVDVRARLVTDLLAHGLVPVLYGDAATDESRGGVVASTERLLVALARHLPPSRVVLATDVAGVFPVDPRLDPQARPIRDLTPDDWPAIQGAVTGAAEGATDVTGGMAAKVALMLELVTRDPAVEVWIVSGAAEGTLLRSLNGDRTAEGTRIRARFYAGT